MNNKLIEGSILKAIFSLSWPVVAANMLQTVYNLTDAFWVGRLGEAAVAAVSFSFPILFLLISIGAGLSIAGTVLVAQYKGKGDEASAGYISAQTLLMITAAAVLISILGYIFTPSLIALTGAEAEVIPGAVSYLRVSFAGLIFLFAFFVFQSLLRGAGEVRLPMLIVSVTVILNFAADPVFVMGWGPVPSYGVAGAAMATIFTQAIAAFMALGMILGGRYGIKIKAAYFKPAVSAMKKIFILGFPSSMEHSVRAFSFTLMVFLVGAFGTTAVASYGIVTRLISFVIMAAVGVAMATTTLVGQNIGAGNPRRAEKTAVTASLFTFAVMTLAGFFLYVFSSPLTAFFISDSPAVIKAGSDFIRIVSLTFGFAGLQIVLGGAFRGAGHTVTAMVLTALTFIVLRFASAYGLSFFWAEKGIWWSFPVSNVVGGLAAAALFMRGGWMKKNLTDDSVFSREVFEESLPQD
ncbi:MAG: MATE family efflux transporter [Elusimicrobiota bacterium]|nr:MATE family efflux transporter [Elusimicrobiota bacterium]